jgi:hypothetical protein
MGSIIRSRKPADKRPANDFYPTPTGLVYELVKTGILDGCETILEPACGTYAISNVLEKAGCIVTSRDLIYGQDFLKDDYTGQHYDAIVTNPPFDLWDEFVKKSKQVDCKKIVMIGRANCFGSHKRVKEGIWDGLSAVFFFDRQIAYDKPAREDGKAPPGMLVTGWFVWTKGCKDGPKIHIIDIDKWITRKGE